MMKSRYDRSLYGDLIFDEHPERYSILPHIHIILFWLGQIPEIKVVAWLPELNPDIVRIQILDEADSEYFYDAWVNIRRGGLRPSSRNDGGSVEQTRDEVLNEALRLAISKGAIMDDLTPEQAFEVMKDFFKKEGPIRDVMQMFKFLVPPD